MSRPRTVGELPIDLGGSGVPWLLVVILAIAAGGAWWYYRDQAVDAKREAANAAAARDRLELAFSMADGERRGWEIRATTAENEKELLEALGEDLADELDRTKARARVATDVRLEVRDSFQLAADVDAGADTTHVHIEREDSTFSLTVDVAIAGRVDPPDAEAMARVELEARIRAMLSVSCDEEGAPHAHAQTYDQRVSVVELRAIVAEDVTCFGGQAPRLLDLRPQITIGNGLLAGAAFTLGLLLGR